MSFSYKSSTFLGAQGPWEIVIGLEVHAQIVSQSKLFSAAPTSFGASPNTQVSFMDGAFPGMLPVLNAFCVQQAIKTGLGFGGHINAVSFFDRKNYFYPDLPSGYQISQFTHPIVTGGFLDIELSCGTSRRIHITRLHLEQDAGKSFHDLYPHASAIDLNRAGVGLMEIVSEPDMRTIEEAALYVKKLRALLRCLGTCDGNMEEGSFRVDANVSVRRPGEGLGTRIEIKNLNSIRFLQQALAYEIQRQVTLLEANTLFVQETRLFDAAKGETRSMRLKEDASDYRYFPDPDLPPLVVDDRLIETIRSQLPELPDEKKARFMETLSLSPYDASVLASDLDVAEFFEEGLTYLKQASPKMFANWLMGDLFAALNRDTLSIKESPVSPARLSGLVECIAEGIISGKIAKDVFGEMWANDGEPLALIDAKGWRQVSDPRIITDAIEKIFAQAPDKVGEYRAGKDKLFAYFIGQVMKEMKGRGNPDLVNQLLKELLDN
jgi:aspartyl-tRNA(Asn)/glutamyl-tRNA(Gln) amidotransferase subunit B